ncbi:CRISPR-associated nuclease/helicase Cas3 subtype I-F/YPEST [compost metagenome]
MGARVRPWGSTDYLKELAVLAELTGLDPRACAQRFGGVQLKESLQGWYYHPLLGFQRRK